jgi:phenylalanyl-tRNA synthetase beta chain
MKFSMKWLYQELETDASPQEIADVLTMIGLELESLENPAETLKDFVVAHVEKAEKHPDADRLKVCQVNNGTETVKVVCGAPNARAGMKGIFAADGMYIPGIDTVLKKSKIRGVESNGMLLSEREMGLSDDHEGIVELDDDAAVGTPALEALGLNDPVIDIGVTPNRGDCLGARGVARDLAAAGIGTLKPLEIEPIEGTFKSPVGVHLDFDDDTKDACPYFVGRYFKGVKNGPSPKWLQDKLLAIGLRPISILVDITNLFTFAYGRPLHVFDADKVNGDIHVRLSKSGEKILALNGKEYTLDYGMTVIADEKVPEALGGVMGGEESGCTEDTVNVFLESAYFDPVRTAMTGRKLNLQSDARFRFERGIDPAFTRPGAELASKLILQLCGGEASELIVVGEEPDVSRSYFLRDGRVQSLGGVDVPDAEIERILTVLGFKLTKTDGGWDCAVPTWRHDVVGEADLVEEVLRIFSFDKIPAVPMSLESTMPSGAVNLPQERRAQARRKLAARGMTEAVTFSFLHRDEAALFGGSPESIALVNPISADLDIMRPSLLPNLIAAAGRNADRGLPDLALFEVGPQYAGENPEDQQIAASGIRTGNTGGRTWSGANRTVDVFDAKADALDVLGQLGAPVATAQVAAGAAASWYHPGRSGAIQLGPKMVLAHFGEIHPRVLKAMDVAGPVVGFEVFLDAVPLPKSGKGPARPKLELSAYQQVVRDFAFVVDDSVAAAQVVNAAAGVDKGLITNVDVFDLFAGDAIGAGKKSVAIAVTLQPTDATMTDEQIDAVAEKIVANVAKQTGGALRG